MESVNDEFRSLDLFSASINRLTSIIEDQDWHQDLWSQQNYCVLVYLPFIIIDLSLRLGCMETDSEMKRLLDKWSPECICKEVRKGGSARGRPWPPMQLSISEALRELWAGMPFQRYSVLKQGVLVPQSSSLTMGSPLRGSLTLSEVVLVAKGISLWGTHMWTVKRWYSQQLREGCFILRKETGWSIQYQVYSIR